MFKNMIVYRISEAWQPHLEALEAALGSPLFQRNGRGVALTDAGARALPEFTLAFDALAAASITEQKRIESMDSMPFEIYRQEYTSPKRLGRGQGAVMVGAESV